MKNKILYRLICFFLLCSGINNAQVKYLDYQKFDPNKPSTRLSSQFMPVFGVSHIRENEFSTENYKQQIDEANEKTPYNFLIPFMRFPNHDINEQVVHDYLKRAAEYAYQKGGVQLVPDLDVRNGRRAFQKKYPDELQKMLRILEVKLSGANATEIMISSLDLEDHMTGGHHYYPQEGKVLRVYAYQKVDGSINPGILQDITSNCEIIFTSGDSVKVKLPAQNKLRSEITHASVMVAFTHLYPDIFGPHLMQFQREIIEQYKDTRIIGVCKDEWGHPAYFPRYIHSGLYDF